MVLAQDVYLDPFEPMNRMMGVIVQTIFLTFVMSMAYLTHPSFALGDQQTPAEKINESFVQAACAKDVTLIEVFSKYPGIDASWVSKTSKESAFTCAARMDSAETFSRLLDLFPTQFLPQQKGSLGKAPIEYLNRNFVISRRIWKNYYAKIDFNDASANLLLINLGSTLNDSLKNDPAFVKFYMTTLMPLISFKKFSGRELGGDYLDIARAMGTDALNQFATKVLSETDITKFAISANSQDLFYQCNEADSKERYCELFLKGNLSDEMKRVLLDRYVKARDEGQLRKLIARGIKFDKSESQLQSLLNQTKWFELVDILTLPSSLVEKSDDFLKDMIFQKENWKSLLDQNKIRPEIADLYTKAMKETFSWEMPINGEKCSVFKRVFSSNDAVGIQVYCGPGQASPKYNFHLDGSLVEIGRESQIFNLETSQVFVNNEGDGGAAYIEDQRIEKRVLIAKLPFKYENSLIVRSGKQIVVYNVTEKSALVYDWNQQTEKAIFNPALSATITNNMKTALPGNGKLYDVSHRFIAECSTKRIYSPDFQTSTVYPQLKCYPSYNRFSIYGQTLVSEDPGMCMTVGNQKFCDSPSLLTNASGIVVVYTHRPSDHYSPEGFSIITRLTGEPRYLIEKTPSPGPMLQDQNKTPWLIVDHLNQHNGKLILTIAKFDLNCGRAPYTNAWIGCQ